MTVAELLEKLKTYDPSAVVCVCDQETAPAGDELWSVEIDDFNCVVIGASNWPEKSA